MKYPIIKITAFLALIFIIIMACRKDKQEPTDSGQTILEGKATIFVDESIKPIIEDQAAVFESQYRAKLELINKPESEIVNMLLDQKAQIAVLTRTLTKEESKVFDARQLVPRITILGTDAIALISNKAGNDTIVDLREIINLLQGKTSKIKGLVFDNPNSSTVRYMDSISGVKSVQAKNVFSMQSHEEILKYIAENPGLIGVVGLNSIVQPYPEWQPMLDKINVMAVRNVKNKTNDLKYYKPNQSNIATGSYPLTRKLYLLNYQSRAGLGMGFASFIAGEIGQRIILKSGLMPIRIPGRNINIRPEVLNNNKK